MENIEEGWNLVLDACRDAFPECILNRYHSHAARVGCKVGGVWGLQLECLEETTPRAGGREIWILHRITGTSNERVPLYRDPRGKAAVLGDEDVPAALFRPGGHWAWNNSIVDPRLWLQRNAGRRWELYKAAFAEQWASASSAWYELALSTARRPDFRKWRSSLGAHTEVELMRPAGALMAAERSADRFVLAILGFAGELDLMVPEIAPEWLNELIRARSLAFGR